MRGLRRAGRRLVGESLRRRWNGGRGRVAVAVACCGPLVAGLGDLDPRRIARAQMAGDEADGDAVDGHGQYLFIPRRGCARVLPVHVVPRLRRGGSPPRPRAGAFPCPSTSSRGGGAPRGAGRLRGTAWRTGATGPPGTLARRSEALAIGPLASRRSGCGFFSIPGRAFHEQAFAFS